MAEATQTNRRPKIKIGPRPKATLAGALEGSDPLGGDALREKAKSVIRPHDKEKKSRNNRANAPRREIPAHAGNRFWMLRSSEPTIYESPQELEAAIRDYLNWLLDNPLIEHKVAQYMGEPVEMTLPKLCTPTLKAMFLHIGISSTCWTHYGTREEFSHIIETAEAAIYSYKIEGAAAGLMNAQVICRELGLKERTDVTSSGEGISAITRTIINENT